MRILQSLFLSLLFAFLFTGCTQQPADGITPPRPFSTIRSGGSSISEPSPQRQEETVTIAEPNDVLTLRQALALTLMHNPALKVFSLEIRAAGARELQSGLWPNPEMEIEVENIGGTGESSGFDSAETTIQLSQLIELGNKAQKRKKVASFESELAGLDFQNKKLEIFSDVTQAFILVLTAQEKLQLSHELLKLSEESFDTVEKRVTAGKDSPLEQNRASVALANITLSHQQAERNLHYARKQLASFWGQDTPLFHQATGSLDQIDALPELNTLMPHLQVTPDYLRAEAEIKKGQAVLDLENAKGAGDISIGAGIKRSNETDDSAFIIGISIPLPIFDRNQGGKQEAAYNLTKSREEKKAAWLRLKKEFNQTYQEFLNAYSQAEFLKEDVLPAAIDMFNAATRAYQQGKVDYLNLLDAQRTLFEVKNDYIDSLAAYHIAKNDIERFISDPNQIEKTSESEK